MRSFYSLFWIFNYTPLLQIQIATEQVFGGFYKIASEGSWSD